MLGQINWLQSRSQFHICYQFSVCASASSAPTIANCKELNKLVRTIRAQPVTLRFWPLKGPHRLIGLPDASFKNNQDKSSQRGEVVFLAEARRKGERNGKGSLIDFESKKIKQSTPSTTVAELYSFIKCYGTCKFLQGLWCDISGEKAPIHMRTDANNLVTTARTTHQPEQRETIHMIQVLRKESNSGDIEDLSHIVTEHCLSDCLTKRRRNQTISERQFKQDELSISMCTPLSGHSRHTRPIGLNGLFITFLRHMKLCLSWMNL